MRLSSIDPWSVSINHPKYKRSFDVRAFKTPAPASFPLLFPLGLAVNPPSKFHVTSDIPFTLVIAPDPTPIPVPPSGPKTPPHWRNPPQNPNAIVAPVNDAAKHAANNFRGARDKTTRCGY
ncbi:hypothetical protein GYMLUDRAFT_65068 [Collybiopsis luxurians FD-317 M1]|uniref:Uncharacterized protein n=1 Tax=Collybiopsis luxurians FD-317 M1 TaxID=944289 RepID=A0A0D0C887_9AGAR|nr:hypothetical protein GYMLUDRAFT_65068 [Collybiopsis luxurians FD-317 M1]